MDWRGTLGLEEVSSLDFPFLLCVSWTRHLRGLNLNQSTGSKLTIDEKCKAKQNKQSLLSLAKGLGKGRPGTARTWDGDRSISSGS